MKRKHWIILALFVAALALTGCGIAGGEPVDVMTTDPEGLWQTLVVWPLAKALVWLNDLIVQLGIPYSWGWAIILFTVIIKVITFPLTLTQIKGMEAQKRLQPKIQELQKKYGKDREKLSQAQMKLYQEAGVNPLSGCLPLVVQMPILFGLYSALVVLAPYLEDARWFWIPDLGFPAYSQGISWIPEAFNAGDYALLAAYLVLPALLVTSQFAMQKWMTPATPDTGGGAAGMTKQISLMMTFMFGFFTLQVPAGLTLYWVTSNLLQMGQQWVITSDRFAIGRPKDAGAITTTNGASAPANSDDSGSDRIVDSSAEPVPTNGDKSAEKTEPKRRKRRRAKRK